MLRAIALVRSKEGYSVNVPKIISKSTIKQYKSTLNVGLYCYLYEIRINYDL